MTDGKLAVIGLGSIGSMALWQASRLTDSVTGFEAKHPAHGRSAVGGDTRLFRMIYKGHPGYYPIMQRSKELWAELEAETGQDILIRCGGLSIGAAKGAYLTSVLETTGITGAEHHLLSHRELAERYPQHNLRSDDVAVFDPNSGALRTDRAVTAAIAAARANGATVHTKTAIDSITETEDGVVITAGGESWTFEQVIVASGGWSRQLLPVYAKEHVETRRVFLSWFVAREPKEFAPERFPVFSRIYEDRSMYGAPTVDGATVKATLDGRGRPALDPAAINRELSVEEIAETMETVAEFFPGLVPTVVRADAFPDLFTSDRNPLLGYVGDTGRVYAATGFSGAGFKMASGYGEIAAAEALGKQIFNGLEFVRPQRFSPR
ncbi:N-methyl-L-tryptophan oxidase [Paenarthrobacter ureafaciens]|uniref:N-methyl-L-tryptophan oxidase n=1 Tax=Paenarthrobacter ureafaciens TaxID=37931 RepID=UPI0015BC5221|nr:N-methyl-L-tryptophan oxidase [Paenarthrobacter ureafaciens]NWL26223.1 N-methyl-L-tryptophan oxidase [Paenarthrobacter ureafaciens]NWL27209.1 N-methyl-L-tryptophan oxidase [Paenarthrobacter ureafaciens]NWL29238.1 N-methyl-L-tryptophan oxidase [Paenarthrobacter ureafaciens]NWL29331.1 N-methyl-L-tryptophan oxidase [Paenarthrobacter ureafaciens]